jgi:aminopeptidase Y
MVYSSRWALCAAVTGATALQIPLLSSNNQALLGHPSGSKPLVNSTELQDLISGDRLLTRAKKLYEIAKLGEEEYNHPTRVIGSAGMSRHVRQTLNVLIDHDKAISEHYPTSMRPFSSLETTTLSLTKAFLPSLAMSLNHDLCLELMCQSRRHQWA